MRLPVTLHLQPSRRLAAALVVAHVTVAGGLLPVTIPFEVKLVAMAALALSMALVLRRHVLQPRFRALMLRADGQVEAAQADGASTTLRVAADTTVFRWLVVLRLCDGDTRIALTLPPDAVVGDGHRELRLWLRWKANATA